MPQNILPATVLAKVGSCQPSMATADIIKRAQAVVDRLESNLRWDTEWRDLVLALGAGRDQALHTAKTNKPQGPKYRAAMGLWLRCYGFDRIEKTDRSRLLFCFDNLTAINAWRATLPAKKQETLNHPRIVLAHWKRSLRAELPDQENTESPPPPPVGKITVDAIVAVLASAELSPADHQRLAKALPPAVIAEVTQHETAKARQKAAEAKAAAAAAERDLEKARTALTTGENPMRRIENSLAVIDHHFETKNAVHLFKSESFIIPKPKPGPSPAILLASLEGGKDAAQQDIMVRPGTMAEPPPESSADFEANPEDHRIH
jgi:hypothetical protein